MFRILFGFLLPLLAIFIAWSFGHIPAKSVFWTAEQAVITDHETVAFDSGFGPMSTHYAIVKSPTHASLRLHVPDLFQMEDVKRDWPVGKEVAIRVKPDGKTAVLQDDPRRSLAIPVIIAIGGLVIMGFAARSFLTSDGALNFYMGSIGSLLVTVAAVLFFGIWTFGTPPATSFFWPTETVKSVSTEVRSAPVGNGTTNWFPVVMITRDGAEPQQLLIKRNVFMSQSEASDVAAIYQPGSQHSVRISPAGESFERYWQFQFTLALVISLLAPVLTFAGIFAMLGALKTK